MTRYLTRAGALVGLAMITLSVLPGIGALFLDWTAASFRPFVRMLPGTPVLEGALIVWPGTSFEIIQECTSLLPTLLVSCVMVSVPSSGRAKLLGVALAAGALWAFNLLRLYAAATTLYLAPGWFDLVHAVIWQGATLVISIGIFLLWQRHRHNAT